MAVVSGERYEGTSSHQDIELLAAGGPIPHHGQCRPWAIIELGPCGGECGEQLRRRTVRPLAFGSLPGDVEQPVKPEAL